MSFIIRQIQAESKFCQHLELSALQEVISSSLLEEVLESCGKKTPRCRKLCFVSTLWWLLASTLFSHLSFGMVLERLAQGLRYLWPAADVLPAENALTYRRYQLGVAPLYTLFRRVCRPLATEQTQGAFLFGLRLMAIDGHRINLPDTPANAAYFGRGGTDRGEAAFPQALGIFLTECGTHALVDAGFWPQNTGEIRGALRLLRSVQPGMLVMWDRGLHAYDLVAGVVAREGEVLSRLSASVKPPPVKRLGDGSWLVWLAPSDPKRRGQGEGRLVRLIEYTLTDPALPGFGEVHRLITTLLDPDAYPAQELVWAYHLRWEVELVCDEIEIHQQRTDTLLRSRKPVGVLQELYALLVAHYAVRFLMQKAAQEANVSPLRLSFVRALRLLDQTLVGFALAAPPTKAASYALLLKDMVRDLLPERRLRSNPRVVKRKMSKFALKRAEHRNIRQPTLPFREAILLI